MVKRSNVLCIGLNIQLTIQVRAKNSEGSDEAEFTVTVQGPPEKPVGPLEILEVNKEGCRLSWKKPESDGGSPVKMYSVERKHVESDSWVPCAQVTGKSAAVMKELECRVTNLVEGEAYVFRVMAINNQGKLRPIDSNRLHMISLR